MSLQPSVGESFSELRRKSRSTASSESSSSDSGDFVTPRCQPCIGVALLRAGSLLAAKVLLT
jgi:hypothetical protein